MPDRPAIEALIPHRPPMLLVESLVEVVDGGIVCRGLVPVDSPFAHRGAASPFFAVELAAQTAAVLEAYHRRDEGGEPRIGYLTSIRQARLRLPELPAGRPLLATVRSRGGLPPLAMYEVTVTLEEDGTEVAEATISTYLTPVTGL